VSGAVKQGENGEKERAQGGTRAGLSRPGGGLTRRARCVLRKKKKEKEAKGESFDDDWLGTPKEKSRRSPRREGSGRSQVRNFTEDG